MNQSAATSQTFRINRLSREARFKFILLVLTGILIFSVTFSVTMGPVPIQPQDVWGIAAYKVGITTRGSWSTANENIVWLIRFPRALLALVVGGGLAVAGVTLQALVRNPLADSYVLGVSSGASLGAVLAIGLGLFALVGTTAISLAGFLGAMVAFLAVFALANVQGRITPWRLVLAGIGVGYFFSGLTSFITLTSNNRMLAGQTLSWTLGSLARANWSDLPLPTVVVISITIYLALQARRLNALVIGDETATTLGINVDSFRRKLFIATALITGVMVAVSGSIAFIGLMVPHIVRSTVRSDHRRVLPISILVGSIFLIWADTIARGFFAPIDAPVELPVGVVTSIFGGPFFVWLVWRSRRARGF